jgi:superfamily II DNA or RNA helicase
MYKCNRKILVLTDRKAHCEYIKNMLNDMSVGIYYGGMKMEELKKTNECRIIVATYQMASEGYDNPELDTLILASPKCNVEQAVGRILRKKNKNIPVVVDINDCISIFNNWNKKRQSFYKSRKFKINYLNDTTDKNTPDEQLKLNECLIID